MALTTKEKKRAKALIDRFCISKYDRVQQLNAIGALNWFGLRAPLIDACHYEFSDLPISMTRSKAVLMINEIIEDPFLGSTPTQLNSDVPDLEGNQRPVVAELTPCDAAAIMAAYEKEEPKNAAAVKKIGESRVRDCQIYDVTIPGRCLGDDSNYSFSPEFQSKYLEGHKLISVAPHSSRTEQVNCFKDFLSEDSASKKPKGSGLLEYKKWKKHNTLIFFDLHLAQVVLGVPDYRSEALRRFAPDYQEPFKLSKPIQKEVNNLFVPDLYIHMREQLARLSKSDLASLMAS